MDQAISSQAITRQLRVFSALTGIMNTSYQLCVATVSRTISFCISVYPATSNRRQFGNVDHSIVKIWSPYSGGKPFRMCCVLFDYDVARSNRRHNAAHDHKLLTIVQAAHAQ